jgi:hypothetical protein
LKTGLSTLSERVLTSVKANRKTSSQSLPSLITSSSWTPVDRLMKAAGVPGSQQALSSLSAANNQRAHVGSTSGTVDQRLKIHIGGAAQVQTNLA